MTKDRHDKLIRAGFVVLAALMIASAGFVIQLSLADAPISDFGVRFQEFPDLARSMLRGEAGIPLDKLETRVYSDVILYDGRLQLPFGPVPIAVFLPFALLPGDIFPTLSITFLFLAAAGALIFRIARLRGLSEKDAAWIAIAYSLGSAVAPLAIPLANSWFVLLIANVFLLLALESHLAGRRTWVTGSFLALAMATRPVSAIGVFTYCLLTMRWRQWSPSISPSPARGGGMGRWRLAALLLPLVFVIIVIGTYNHLRFGDFTESGYGIQWQADPVLKERMTYGAMDLRYILQNLWYFLLKPPNIVSSFPFVIPDGMGMGIIFGSPFILYIAFSARRWRQIAKPLAAAAIGLVPALAFFASGFSQIGYRYAVDVYPLLFLALIAAWGSKVPRFAKALIAFAVASHLVWTVVLLT